MPSETNGDAGPIPVMLTVETEGNKKFKVVTTDLGTIASQLRPKASFSVFNSVLVPIGVTVLTALLTTTVGQLFQYVSWRNSTTQQEAQDQVTNATAAYNNAAVEIAKRYYRTLVFIGAIQDLVKHGQDIDSALYQLDFELDKRRFNDYYEQLRNWNETNDQIMGEIDFGLDRPVDIVVHKRYSYIEKIDCKESLTEQLEKNGLEWKSLKLQFAVITSCFRKGIKEITEAKDKATADSKFTLEQKVKDDSISALSDVMSMANEFRCYALSRIQFLKSRRSNAIYIPEWLEYIKLYTQKGREKSAKDEDFKKTQKECSF